MLSSPAGLQASDSYRRLRLRQHYNESVRRKTRSRCHLKETGLKNVLAQPSAFLCPQQNPYPLSPSLLNHRILACTLGNPRRSCSQLTAHVPRPMRPAGPSVTRTAISARKSSSRSCASTSYFTPRQGSPALSLSLPLTLSLSFPLSFPFSLSLSLSLSLFSLSFPLYLSLSHTHTGLHTQKAHSLSLFLSLSLTHSLSLSHTHTNTGSHIQTAHT